MEEGRIGTKPLLGNRSRESLRRGTPLAAAAGSPCRPSSNRSHEAALVTKEERANLTLVWLFVVGGAREHRRSEAMEVGSESTSTGARILGRVLIIEDEESIRRALERFVASRGAESHAIGTVNEAMTAITAHWDLILLDLHLLDGSGVTIAEACSTLRPRPLVIAITGSASPAEAFALARCGVAGFVQKPYALSDIERAVDMVLEGNHPIDELARACVGEAALPEVEAQIGQVMIDEALQVCAGNRTAAAELLGLSRESLKERLRRRVPA